MDVSSWDLWSAKCRFDFEDKQKREQRHLQPGHRDKGPARSSLTTARTRRVPSTLTNSKPTRYSKRPRGDINVPTQHDTGLDNSDASGDTEEETIHDSDNKNNQDIFNLWAKQEYLPSSSQQANNDSTVIKRPKLKDADKLTADDFRRSSRRGTRFDSIKSRKDKRGRKQDDGKIAQWRKVHGKWTRRA